MKNKQIIGVVAAGAVIIAVGVTGVVSNVIGNRLMTKETDNAKGIVKDIMSTTMESSIKLPEEDFIGVLNIEGEIGASSSGNAWTASSGYNHELYMDYVEKMEESDNNKGILLYVDSPGGAVYQSDEMYLRLMEYKEKTGRPIWAYFSSQACSGGYYIAMAADKIYANRNCWTGSIGVIVSLVNCKDLYDKIGIKEIDITSGENKAMGSAGLELTDEQYDIMQSLVDEAYDQFVEIVCNGRNMDDATVRKLADGRIYSAKQACDNGLIDQVGSLEEEKAAFQTELGVSEDIIYYEPESDMPDWMTKLFGAADKLIPKSELQLANDIMENKGSGVLKYYAE